MKKRFLLIMISLFAFSCADNTVNSINSIESTLESIESASSYDSFLDLSEDEFSSLNDSLIDSFESEYSSSSENIDSSENVYSSSSENIKKYTLKEIQDNGKKLVNDTQGELISFEAKYVKVMTDNNDKLMMFVDETSYIYVRVSNNDYKGYLENRYLDCDYYVEGYLSKINDRVEVNYVNLSNITSSPSDFDYSLIAEHKDSIYDVANELNDLTLSKKYNAVGKIVEVEGVVISTEYNESNKKITIYDEKNVITIVNNKTICSKDSIGNKYKFYGALSILNGAPALWYLDSTFIEKCELFSLSFESSSSVNPSYFSSYYNVSNKVNNPTIYDFVTLYKVTGYVKTNSDITTKYSLGMVDTYSSSLSDNGIKTSIKGIFLMNNLSLDLKDIEYSPYYDYFDENVLISTYASLYQFDTQNHGWKMFGIDSMITINE